MVEGLTPEVADTVKLPLNPVSRHLATVAILSDPEMVGDLQVAVNPSPNNQFSVEAGGTGLMMYTINPFLGRRTLRKVADRIQWLNDMDSRGGNIREIL